MASIITYRIVSDHDDRLRKAAKVACDFWNHFIQPESPLVLRMGASANTNGMIALSFAPYKDADGSVYSYVQFNTAYLRRYSRTDLATILIHEIAHALGFGRERWKNLFDWRNGRFLQQAVAQLPALKEMRVETHGGRHTRLMHWDERRHDNELMTGTKDRSEYVLPVTIDVMALLGHTVVHRLESRQRVSHLLEKFTNQAFTRGDDVASINLDHFVETDVLEEFLDDA